MKKTLKTTLIQADLIWEDPQGNIENFDRKINRIGEKTDLIILPEMFTTGFTMNPAPMAEKMDGKTVQWMQQKAVLTNALIMGTLIIEEDQQYFNRLIAAFPGGEVKYYDKRHLFTYAKEDEVFTSGKTRLIFKYKGFRIMPLICYDLRFPVWARNTLNYDILIYMANWPVPRIKAWDLLLKARAIENMSYVIGVNRVGTDKNQIQYSGHSAVIDAFGKDILTFKAYTEATKSIDLDLDHIKNTRKRFGFLNDKDKFEFKF